MTKIADNKGHAFEKPEHASDATDENEIITDPIEEEGDEETDKYGRKPPGTKKPPYKKKARHLKDLPSHLKSGRTPGDTTTKHVPIIGGSRRFGAYTRPVNIDISEKMLPPITRKKIATYEVLQFTKKDPLIKEGDAEIAPAPVILPGRYSIYDPWEKDLANTMKVIQNIVGKERKDWINPLTGANESRLVDNIQEIIMENGFLTVNMETEYPKYVFMELHPMNQTCKWHGSSNQAKVFRRADFQYQSSISRQFEADLQLEAEIMVKNMAKDEVINLASGFGMPTMGRRIDEIRYELRMMCRQDPKKVMFQKRDSMATIRINIADAIEWGLIEYVPEKMSYFFASNMNQPMHVVPVGEDPQHSLGEYFLECFEAGNPDDTDSWGVYTNLLDLLSFWQ